MRRLLALGSLLLVLAFVATASTAPLSSADRTRMAAGAAAEVPDVTEIPEAADPSVSPSPAPAASATAEPDRKRTRKERPGGAGQSGPRDPEEARDAARDAEELASRLLQPQPATLLQLNMCLSGVANCYSAAGYPAKIREAVATIRSTAADVVVINEACSGDAALIAQQAGMSLNFSTVARNGRAFACRDPRGRGSFGNAVLSEVPADVQDVSFRSQAGPEERRAVCSTLQGLTVCGTHLTNQTDDGTGRAANARQCAELSAMLARTAQQQPVVAAGDVNRRTSCAPAGFATFTDAGGTQARGIQHVYLDPRLGPASARTLVMRQTNHDALVLSFVRPPLSGGLLGP